MPKRSALYPGGYGSYRGGVGTADQAQSNVLLPISGSGATFFGFDFTSAHTWAWIWGLVLPVSWLAVRWWMHGGRRGGVV